MSIKPILAYDCACQGASIALRVNGNTYTSTITQNGQAAELIPAIDTLMREHAVNYADLAAIVTTTGPGSFTGVRIGLAALHGFVQVTHTPIKLLTTLEAIAWQVAREANCPPRFTITLRAGKGEVYTQDFELTTHPAAISEITVAPETKTDWALPCFNHLPTPSAELMAHIAEQLPTATLAEAIPHYIRPPDAAIPQAYSWLKAN